MDAKTSYNETIWRKIMNRIKEWYLDSQENFVILGFVIMVFFGVLLSKITFRG